MESILFDSTSFSKLNKKKQTQYVEKVVTRMTNIIGQKNTEKVLFECGSQCCGKPWSKFVKEIWDRAKSIEVFFTILNQEEEKYSTQIKHIDSKNLIIVERSKCICGLVNKGLHFQKNKEYCKCSNGHMSAFFNSIFDVISTEPAKNAVLADLRVKNK